MADQPGSSAQPKCTAPELLLKVVLIGTLSHYETRGMIDEKRLEHLLHAGKQILYKSHQESDVRQNLGFSANVWQGLTDVLTTAVPVLESQSFARKTPNATTHEGPSSNLIANNYLSLAKDIERLNDLCTIARNLLATTKKAQNLAAEKGFDQQILKLIDVCVRVTARGFDGESNARNEERWQKVVNLYKRLLITCLQFLHNFIVHNEHRKLVLWLDLFGNSQNAVPDSEGDILLRKSEQIIPQTEAQLKCAAEKSANVGATISGTTSYSLNDVHALLELMSDDATPAKGSTQEAAKLLMKKIRDDMEKISGMSVSQLDSNPEQLAKAGATLREALTAKGGDWAQLADPTNLANVPAPTSQPVKNAIVSIDRSSSPGQARTWNWTDLPDMYGTVSDVDPMTPEDMTMPRTSQSAAETLQEAKDELMTRLQESSPILGATGEQQYDIAAGDVAGEDDARSLEALADGSEDDEEDDDDYRNPGDQERGLLTDIPLVLGPSEIEALPMIIQAGIVDSFGLKGGERSGSRNMQAVRCHILLAQETGRNLLRELLIFIAAWDLPDDEFYFKMMVQIMEAILKNGLMSHAYSAFGQAKDIISPAQAVVIKLLTHIFRSKYSPTSVTGGSSQAVVPRNPVKPKRVDVLTVRYIFSVFRGNIIPETCALVYLQGQIRGGHALPEDFPLNLWDMERVYEGVYQFLEFFAVLTESNEWKGLLVEWEIVYDLVTLIKELDASIPKAPLNSVPPPTSAAVAATEQSTTDRQSPSPAPVAVERPYDPGDPETSAPPALAESDTAPLGTEDPSEFEWRNLKKLVVLVLSSLVWKSKSVQEQIRKYGGVEMILACTNFDAHNPYIKEHAVMCLKFLLEGNRENQRMVEELEAREGVSDELLERHGYETFVDEMGKVALRQKEGGQAQGDETK